MHCVWIHFSSSFSLPKQRGRSCVGRGCAWLGCRRQWRRWGGLEVDLGTTGGGLGVDFGFPLVVANEISSNAFLGSPILTKPCDALIRVVGWITWRGFICPLVSPDKGEEGVGLRFGHTTRTQERAQRLQVWKGRKKTPPDLGE